MSNQQDLHEYIDTLPSGIKRRVEWMVRDGAILPTVAIRVWREVPSMTDDGRSISSSGSYWDCIAFAGSRQEAGFLTAAIWKEYHLRCEVWYLEAFNNAKGPHIIDHEPNLTGLFGAPVFYGPQVHWQDITEPMVRDFARAWSIDYYQIHTSNERYVTVDHVQKQENHHANWFADVTFSVNKDRVRLHISSSINGLHVFSTDYSIEKEASHE